MQIRLLPVVLVAICALLVLKTIGLVTEGQYALSGTEFAQAQSIDENVTLTPEEEAAALRAADTLFSNTSSAPIDEEEPLTILEQNGSAEDLEEIVSVDEAALTERAILERLGERRAELDRLADELALRADLVTAAENRLNERLAELEAVEARVQALVDQFDSKADEQFMALVSMYEGMKSSDAAKVFNLLESDVLLRLASQMSPRKMSPILADMDSARAQELTMRLANLNAEAKVMPEPQQDMVAELPQIIGQ